MRIVAIEGDLRRFAAVVTENFATAVPAQPEDQLKAPVSALLSAAGDAMRKRVQVRTEAQVAGLGARPDIGVAVDSLLTGHVELKAPGKGANPQRFRGEDAQQWERFQGLPNLIYTDGNEWTLFRYGSRQGNMIRLAGDVTADGAEAVGRADAEQLHDLLRDFLFWEPVVPANPKALAELLAPLCRLIRRDVEAALRNPSSNLSQLAAEWRQTLFPDADDLHLADAYAQTLTYALLLARLTGEADLEPDTAAAQLDSGHGVLAQALRILGQPLARGELGVGVDLLARVIRAIDVAALQRYGGNPWLYFYEDFLAAYDPKLRNDRGVYYTPAQVIHAQVRLVSCLLENRDTFNKQQSYADGEVVVLDPAAGTGAYPLAVLQHGLEMVSERFGPGAAAGYAASMARNLHAFENLVGPYAVAHLRLTQSVLQAGGTVPDDGVHVYLTDTLESPYAQAPVQPTLQYRQLTDEHRRAQDVKQNTRILVCIGNPPYDRQEISPENLEEQRRGGWVRFGEPGERAILEDFIEPVRASGQGVHIKNLYNDYVYFWRWALWKVFESHQGSGIVSFITAASYLRGPGFAGMREAMRRMFDDLWIINLEGDNRGARKTENVFNIETPVAIAVGVRYGPPRPETAANSYYVRIQGSKEDKFDTLDAVRTFTDLDWQPCYSDWSAPFLPQSASAFANWPLLTDVFPWQHSGVQYKRTWPIGETKEVLQRRWNRLTNAPASEKAKLFRETPGCREVSGAYTDMDDCSSRLQPIAGLERECALPSVRPYAFRSFDRHWAIVDNRLADRIRTPLWSVHCRRQVYMTSLLTEVLGEGPSATVTGEVPDLHHFRGSFGGKHVIPLWRDPSAEEPNVTRGLLNVLEAEFGATVAAEDVFTYCYAILASPAYVQAFWDELYEPGPRIPLTRTASVFSETSELGRRLIFLHTYAERLVPNGAVRGVVPKGRASNTRAISPQGGEYPEKFSYDRTNRLLYVGGGEIAPVDEAVWDFSVSGLHVLHSWLSYRMKKRAGKASSPLDGIRPDEWSVDMTRELMELIWVLEATTDMFPALKDALDRVLSGPLLAASDLPLPTEDERKPPCPDVCAPVQNGFGFDAE